MMRINSFKSRFPDWMYIKASIPTGHYCTSPNLSRSKRSTVMRNFLVMVSGALVILSCNDSPDPLDTGTVTDVFTKIYTVDNIQTQTYTINNSLGGIITGNSGTKIRISKNTFVDNTGQAVQGEITLELKEALSPLDMVLGNLTTVYNGKPLETGGMIYVNARLGDRPLDLAPGKTLLVAVPTDSTLSGMSIFQGDQDSLGVEWTNPIPIADLQADSIAWDMSAFEKTTNIKYRVDGYRNADDSPQEIRNEVGRIAWQGDGLKIAEDSAFLIGEHTIHFIKQRKLLKWSDLYKTEKGTNSYLEDHRTNYIFTLRKMGWANIDRLYNDPRTREVDLIVNIDNHADFNMVYVTLVTQNMYLPGYQKKDDTFSFSHGDHERQQLPIGEAATIIATAYKNDKPFFSIRTLTIEEASNVQFHLEETTMDKLRTELVEKI